MAEQKKIGRLVLFWGSVFFFFFWLLKPAVLGQLGGTFKSKEIPQEYIDFKDFINGQDEFFRTFWVPKKQRFGFYSNLHPAIATADWVEDSKCLKPLCDLKIAEYNRQYFKCHTNEKCFPADASFLANPKVLPFLIDFSVKYLVIPYDSEGEIFLYEREYDPEHRQKLEDFLDTISWLKKVEVADKIAVYELIKKTNN